MMPAEAEIYRALVKEFRTQGVGVGLPQREIFLLSGASHAMAA